MEQEKLFERYSIFQACGKQFQALEGKTVELGKLDVVEGQEVVFNEVLLRRTDAKTVEVGTPFLKTPVKAVVIKHGRGPKVVAFSFKRRKKHRKTIGHRQDHTIVRITSI